MDGLMQHDFPLTLLHVLDRMRGPHGAGEVVTQREGSRRRTSYAEVAERVDRLAAALRELGVERGDRVATFAWNSQEHLELYFAVPCSGAILHTLNIRLFEEDLEYIVGHAADKVVFVDDSLVERLEPLADRLPSVRHYVVIGDGDAGSLPNAVRYDELVDAQQPGFDYPRLDDRLAAGLCYTSGTTGNPKGVLYSHRAHVLHALGVCAADSMALSSRERALPVVPMFHANAWGIPHAAALTGADLLLPSRFTDAASLLSLIADERVTFAAAVPTIWLDVLRHADEAGAELGPLHTIICGGAAVPLSLMRAFEDRHGVRVLQAWGMTETGPLASVARAPRGAGRESQWRYRDTAGRLLPFVEARVVADDGTVLPHDGESDGELEVRGPWVASAYYGVEAPEKFDDGWLRTGDVASIDPEGYIRITDRAKDVIKSGGEWISSVALENELLAHPGVLEAAVIAKPDERWTERPLACVVRAPDATCDADELREHLAGRVAKWWLPDEFAFIDEVPKTGTGKFDKKVLRQRLAEGALTPESSARSA
ncbi:MAG TPA: long-chain fatty acid--CoA ligase [Solirubrobacteraceae bacterium]|nr:long-chain fatty acid--CoA ligase [Solirubrobacteraceae bacterium]